jgi:hypothetical protein
LKNVFTFYVPQEYLVGDSANWNDTELGMYKGFIDNVTKQSMGGDSGKIAAAAKQAVGEFKNDANAGLILANTIGAGTPIGDISAGIMRNEKLAVNPNLVLMYRGNGIRQYNFMFRMIAQDEDEAYSIEQIAHEFRAGSYGSKNGQFLLDYPDQFKFVYMAPGGKSNQFLPAPATLALQSVTMSNNPSTNLFHANGAPVEVTLSLMFREIRALDREDIERLRGIGIGRFGSDFENDDNTWLV